MMIRTILTSHVCLCGYVIVLLQALSLFGQIAVWPVTLGLLAGALAAAIALLPRLHQMRIRIRRPGSHAGVALPFALVLPALFVLLLVQGWHFPANDWDAMTYHLARAAFWRQWHSLAPYTTNNWRQVAFPGNVDVLYTAMLVVAHSARAVFLIPLAGYLTASMAIYGLSIQAGARPTFALMGAGIFATAPEVVLQGNAATADLVTASFLLCAVYFFVEVAQEQRASSLVLMGVACGLALGAKPTPVLALPGLALGGVLLLRHQGLGPLARRTWLPAAGAALGLAVILAAPWYISNRIQYGSIGGPPAVAHEQQITHPTIHTFRITITRYLIGFLDPAGPALITPITGDQACERLANLRADLAAWTGIDVPNSAVEMPDTTYFSHPICYFDQSLSWYGLTGALVLFAALGYAVAGIVRQQVGVPWLCAAGCASYLLYSSIFLHWQPWEGRLLTPVVGLACPTAAVLAQAVCRYRAGKLFVTLIAVYAAIGGPTAAALNNARPLAAWGDGYTAALARSYHHYRFQPVLDAVDRLVPRKASLGIMLPANDNNEWEFPLFGRSLDRTVVPIKLPPLYGEGFGNEPLYAHARPFRYLFAHVPSWLIASFLASEPGAGCREIWSYDYGFRGPYRIFRCSGQTMSVQRP